MAGTAATNLSFIYFLVSQSQQLYVILSLLLQILFLHIFMRLSLAHCYQPLLRLFSQESDIPQAEKFANSAMAQDRYNPQGEPR